MAYTKTSWSIGNPITADKMNNIEDGIANAHSSLTTMATKTEVNELVNQAKADASGALSKANEALSAANTANNNTVDGQKAWTYVAGAMTFENDGSGTVRTNLATRFSNDERDITAATNSAAEAKQWINDAKAVNTVLRNGQQVTANSLAEKISDIDRKIADVVSTAGSITTILNPESGRSVTERLTALDSNTVPSMTVPAIITELSEARGQNSDGGNNTSLAQRFSQDETQISANTTAINNLTTDKVNYNDIVDNLNQTDTNKALSANQGNVIKQIIGSGLDTEHTISNAIATAQTNAQTYADTNKIAKTDIYYGIDHEADDKKVLDARVGKMLADMIDTIDSSTSGTTSGLATRILALESELDMSANIGERRIDDIEAEILNAHTSTVIRTQGAEEGDPDTDTTYSSLDERFETIEAHVAAADTITNNIRADVNTIADELNMYTAATHTIAGQNSRLDQMEANLVTMANEIGMLQNEEEVQDMASAISDQGTRIDTIDDDLDAVKTEIGNAHRTGLVDDQQQSITDTLDNRFDDIETAISGQGGLNERMTAAETVTAMVTNQTTGLAATKAIADANALAINGQGGLDERISALEENPASTTEIISVAAFEALVANEANSTKDYLVGPDNDNLYKYYRIIETSNNVYEKVLISGGGSGTGNSSGEFAATLESITNPDINTDYFVGNNTDGYLHYRFIEQENSETLRPVLIGVDPNNIKRYNIERVLGKKREYNSETQTWTTTDEDVYYLNLYEFNYGTSNAQSNIEETMIPIGQIELPQGGGGGSTISTAPRVVRITPSNITTVQSESHIYLRFFYAAIDATGESYDSTYTLKYNNGSIIDSGTLNSGAYDQTVTTGVWPAAPRPVGFYEIDVTDYCRLGTQTFNLTVTVNGQNIPRAWTINILELRLESSATQSQLIEVGNTIQFPYTPYGAMTKTLYVQVDGTTIKTQPLGASVSGSELEVTIPSQTQGAHTISIYLEAVLDGETIPTPSIKRDYIWYNADSENQIIIASPYRYATINTVEDWDEWVANTSYNVGDKVKITSSDSVIGYICIKANTDSTFNIDNWDAQVINVQQYEEIEIPYTIYNSEAVTSTVKYYINDTLLDTVSITNNGIFNYVFEEFGEKQVRIEVEDTSLEFNIIVKEVEADIAPVTGAVINFDPSTLTNTSTNRLPTWTYNNETYHMTVSSNFNWSNDASGGGYKEDEDGKCFVIKAGTYAEFDYKMFKMAVNNTDPENPVYTSSVFDKGAEMKIIFKVAAVRDAGAVWFSNVGNPSSTNKMPIGIQLSAHQGWLKTSAADAAEKQAQREGTVASTNSYLYFPYSEEDKIELDISINRTGNREDFIMSYEDGVPSKAYAYETAEILYHETGNESVIRIGSPDCDVYIYKFRIYDKGLGTSDILRNFIADGKTVTDKVNRYNRNSIYYDSTKPEGQQFTPYKTGSAILDPEKLAEKMPDVKILMLEAPTFTKDKKNFIKSSLRCIHAPGGTVYPSRGDEDNWFFQKGYHSGQGTTSDNYGQSSRNVDFLFECDGTNRPSDKVEAESGYVSTLIKGVNKSVLNPTTKSWTPTVDAVTETCSDWKGNDAKVSLTATSIPNNYFNLKVNVASSENVNNALFQKRYNDFLPYISPAKARDNRIKNDMEFVPAILFIRETDTTQDESGNYTKHLEFNDTEWHFYSLGNIGDSKKTDYTRAYDPTDENEFTVEVSDNNTSNSQFQSGVYLDNNVRIVEEYDTGTLNSMNYIWDITDEEWNAQRDPTEKEIDHDYRVDEEIEKYEDGTDVENNLTHYILPNGKVYVNYRHRMLSGDPFDGDHTFEFRYASCGDYRDGKIVNPKKDDTDPERVARYKKNKAQEKLNRGIIEAFYEWLIKASNDEFVDELAEWCVPEALEYFYAFTHFYTMMDNRAKNTFWHFAKTGTPRIVHHPHPALLHVYTELNNGEYEPTEDTEIDPEKTYYTEYAFDLWAYDMDTAAGIDNNGELIFPYGKEDTDYRQAGVSSSGYVFNGAGSIIWRRLSQSFTNEIADIFDRVNEQSCFDAASLITQFDNFQNCYPEEMWRLDIERKYVRTFTGKVYDNCKLADTDGNTKQNTRFLKEMMQGRKKYQRRQWVRDQGIYFGSKYMLSNVRNNTIEMVCYTPDAPIWNSNGYSYLDNGVTRYRPFVAGDFTFYGENNNRKLYKCIESNTDTTFVSSKWVESVTPDYKLKITPYQDMYINVAVGNGNLRTPQRAIAGQEYTVDCTSSMNETRVYIYAGSYIQALSGLAPFYIGANIFSSAARLKKLDLGTDNPYYHNTNLKALTILSNMPILEELNIKNCDSLNTPINLSESNNLKIVEAEGSVIPSLSLPAYTSIETLHLPSTVNTLTLQSARKLTSFYMINKETGLEDYSSLLNMNISDSDYSDNVDWISIALAALPHLNALYLRELNTASIQDMNELEPFAMRKEELETQYDDQGNLINKLNLTGIINVMGSWSSVEQTNYRTIWPLLSFNTNSENESVKCAINYYHSSYIGNNGTVPAKFIKTIFVDSPNGIIPDIYANVPEEDLPQRDPTIAEIFSFGSYNEEGYISYSGWTTGTDSTAVPLSDTYSISNPYQPPAGVSSINLYTFFNTEEHRYTVQWKINDRIIKYVANQKYGAGYTLKAPTIPEIRAAGIETVSVIPNSDGTFTYKIFEGWDKLPTNIAPNADDAQTSTYVINAKWSEPETRTVNDNQGSFFEDITSLTSKQLYILSRLGQSTINANTNTSSIVATRKFNYKMGYNGQQTGGIEIINDNNIRRMGATTTPTIPNNTIHPFAQDKGFTLVIDYQFGESNNNSSPEVLVGCYDKDSSGSSICSFALYRGYNENNGGNGTFVCYGVTPYSSDSTKRRAVGDAKHRNIVVLRREKNSPILRIYTSADATATTNLNTTISENSFIELGTQNISADATICIGALRADLSSNSKFSNELNNTRNAQGTVYWMKYWDEDLGLGECLQLASWPHEDMTAIITSVNTAANRPKLYFTNLNCSKHSIVTNSTFAVPSANNPGPFQTGWASSNTKALCDNRLFNGLPCDLQAMIGKPSIGYYDYVAQYYDSSTHVNLSSLNNVESYIYVPSVSSIDKNYAKVGQDEYGMESIFELTGDTTLTTSDITPYTWFGTQSAVIEAKKYLGSGGEEHWTTITPEKYWFNIRFNEKPISWSTSKPMRIFVIESSTIGSETFYSAIGDSNIQSGDIVIYKTSTSGDSELYGVYMYITASEQSSQGIQTLPADGYWNTVTSNRPNGGWIKSTPYVTRSVALSAQKQPNYIFVDEQGALHFPSVSNDQAAAGSLSLDFAFTI